MNRPDASEAASAPDATLARPLLEALVEQMPSGVLVAEAPSLRVLYANRQMEGLIGAAALHPGSDALAGWKGFHPNGRPLESADWPLVRAMRRGESVTGEEFEIVRQDGSRGLVRMSASPLRDEDGEIFAALMTCLDITDQRRAYISRKFLADAGALLSSSLDHVTTLRTLARLAVPTLADWCTIDLLDAEGNIQRVAVENLDRKKAAAAADLARRRLTRVETGRGVAAVIRGGRSRLIPEVTPEILESFSEGPAQLRILRELGIASVMIVPLIAGGKTLGAISFVSVESGRRYSVDDLELAEELASRAALAIENSRLQSESQAATEAKSDFLAVVSHELRTPLTAIIGYAELLQLGVPEPVTSGQQEQAERIEISARHLLQLIEEILTLVTLESGESRLREEEVLINDLLDRAVGIVEPMARAKGLVIAISHAKGDPVLLTDTDKLLQVLLNLLSNAIKFTERGEIGFAARLEDESVVLEVRDTGIGLGPEHQRQVFEPFWQVERPITRRAGGTGLGLTIARRLCDLLGGEISMESELGVGSTFAVRVPLAPTIGPGGAGNETFGK